MVQRTPNINYDKLTLLAVLPLRVQVVSYFFQNKIEINMKFSSVSRMEFKFVDHVSYLTSIHTSKNYQISPIEEQVNYRTSSQIIKTTDSGGITSYFDVD